MAQGMLLLGHFFLAVALQLANGQGLPESVFKVLTAEELRDINLRQNPELLDIAARTGETVTIEISASSQGAVVQEDVTTILDCGPWLQNFPGGTVRWYRYRFTDLDHTDLEPRVEQIPETLNEEGVTRVTITGEFNEIFTIVRALISVDAEDSSRGVYECEVCIARDIDGFEVCHSANTTVATAGRPPIIDCGTGRDPISATDTLHSYNIGSTICIIVDPSDPINNRPLQSVRFICGDVGSVEEENIPSAIPPSNITWEHTSLEGLSAFFAIDATSSELSNTNYMPPMQFEDTFPGLAGSPLFTVPTDLSNALEISVTNITSNLSRPDYQLIRMAFGLWTCTLTNSLGSQTKTSFISDSCGDFVPSIVQDCDGIGPMLDGFFLVDERTSVPVPAGCNVCVDPDASLFLTLTCPTNIGRFPNASIRGYRWTENSAILSVSPFLSVSSPGEYTCTVLFDGDESDSATSTVSYAPDVEISATRRRSGVIFTDSGCDMLRRPDPNVQEGDVCAFFDSASIDVSERVTVMCESRQESVMTSVIINGMSVNEVIASEDTNGSVAECDVSTSDPSIEEACAGIAQLTIHTYEPAKILVDMRDTSCTASAGQLYSPVSVSSTTATLCCQVVGFPEPISGWFRLEQLPSGDVVERPVNFTENPDYSFDPILNRITIQNYDPARDDGTFVCRAMNIAGIDVASLALLTAPVEFEWQTTEWCDCDPFCVDGTRSRRVWCEFVRDGTVVADTNCGCDSRPPEMELCTNVPGLDQCFLRPLWKTGEFSACSKGCSGGVRFREVYCALPLDGTRLEDFECIEEYGPDQTPPSYDICFNTCCTTDDYPEYCRYTGTGPCDNPIYQQHCCWTCGLSRRG